MPTDQGLGNELSHGLSTQGASCVSWRGSTQTTWTTLQAANAYRGYSHPTPKTGRQSTQRSEGGVKSWEQ
jgi:hypothetical protein